MKFNWGHAMVLALLAFMVFILSFMVRLNISELVTDDYYSQEVKYQALIEGQKNYNALAEKPSLELGEKLIKIHFPTTFNNQNIMGSLVFFRPSDSEKDLKIPIQLDQNNTQKVSTTNFATGKYYVILDWQTNARRYYSKQTIKIK